MTIAFADILRAFGVSLSVGLGCALLLLMKSLTDFSRSGPQINSEIVAHYVGYTVYAVARLFVCAAILLSALGWVGNVTYFCAMVIAGRDTSDASMIAASLAGIGACSFLQFTSHLLYMPSSLLASWQYRFTRLYPLWRRLTPTRIRGIRIGVGALPLILSTAAIIQLTLLSAFPQAALLFAMSLLPFAVLGWTLRDAEPPPVDGDYTNRADRPNIVMIGSDTLRADRVGGEGYSRSLTPAIDRLAATGHHFRECYVPLARTAPSLVSLLSGTWPHTHGIRDNYVADADTRLRVATLPKLLRRAGYRSLAVTDWAGGDLKKLDFGYDLIDGPNDQWNLKYYIRQGPKDLRLFISLFTHNRLGKKFLPELYYLAGVPLTANLGRRAREMISDEARRGQPFHLNVFMSTTHVPFGSEYPYYQLFTDPAYSGASKFVMTTLRDPNEIIAQQELPKDNFDLDQIVNLYDACVRRFDDEVGRIVKHLEACNLLHNTIVVIYSDHGVDLFENGTWGQGNTVLGNDVSARTPLILFSPHLSAHHTDNKRIDQTVRSVDLVPTLLELAGIETDTSFDGESLVPAMRSPDCRVNLDVYQETGIWVGRVGGMHPRHIRYPNILDLLEVPDKQSGTLAIKPEYLSLIIEAKDRMVRSGRWKLVYQPLTSGPLFELFDLEKDPYCRNDVAAQHPDVLNALMSRLAAWMETDASAVSIQQIAKSSS